MNCPGCNGFVELHQLNVDKNAEEDGIELSFCCRLCQGEFFAILTPDDFEPVD